MKDQIVEILVNEILPAEWQPREEFNEELIKELAQSLEEKGIIQPIVVRKHENGYQIIAGERRWRAAKLNREETIMAIVKDVDNLEAKELSIIENWQRQDLTDHEKEKFIYNLWIEGFMNCKYTSQADMARKIGIPSSTVTKIVRSAEDRASFKNFSNEKVVKKATTHDLNATTPIRNDAKTRMELLEARVDKKINQSDLRPISKAIATAPLETRKGIVELISNEQLKPKKVGSFVEIINKSPRDIQEKLLTQEITPEEAVEVNTIEELKQREEAIENNKATKKADYDNNMVEQYESIYTNKIALFNTNDIQSIENEEHKEICIDFVQKIVTHCEDILSELEIAKE